MHPLMRHNTKTLKYLKDNVREIYNCAPTNTRALEAMKDMYSSTNSSIYNSQFNLYYVNSVSQVTFQGIAVTFGGVGVKW